MISIRASSLDEFASCQRRFAAKWLLDDQHEWCSDFGLKRTKRTIGALVGTAAHAGVAYLMNELKRTGSHGGALRTRQAKAVAAEEMHKEDTGPIITDNTTSTADAGMVAAHKIVDRYHQDVRHEYEPVLVEKGLGMEVSGHRITGTMDTYLVNGQLEDLKTGVRRPEPFAQIGAYSILIKANGLDLEGAKIRYAKRVGKCVPQPPIEEIGVDVKDCERHMIHISSMAAMAIDHLLTTGDPAPFIANPKDQLCGPKYCPAYGSKLCPYGNMMK